MADAPLFSVLVPVYNHEAYVGAALDSLLAQTFPAWEAVVVDDGSTDGTPQLVDAYAARDPRIRVSHKPNGGSASALNAGVRNARAPWICWLSSDDLFEPEKLAVHAEWFEREPTCRFFFTDFKVLDGASGALLPAYISLDPDPRWQVIDLLSVNYVNGISICVHRDVFAQCGVFDESNRYGQDYDLLLRVISATGAVRIPVPTCQSRRHPGQGSRTGNSDMFLDCCRASHEFLNRTHMSDMRLAVDGDGDSLRDCVDRVLDIAESRQSIVSMAGPSVALVARLAEWLWGLPPDRPGRSRARRLFRSRVAALARVRTGRIDGELWRAMALVSAGDLEGTRYRSVAFVDALHLKLAWAVHAGDTDMREMITGYVARRELDTPGLLDEEAFDSNPLSVVVFNRSAERAETAQRLARAGHRVTRVDRGAPGLGLEDGVLVCAPAPSWPVARAAASLPPFDVAVGRPPRGAAALFAERLIPGAAPVADLASARRVGRATRLSRTAVSLADRGGRFAHRVGRAAMGADR